MQSTPPPALGSQRHPRGALAGCDTPDEIEPCISSIFLRELGIVEDETIAIDPEVEAAAKELEKLRPAFATPVTTTLSLRSYQGLAEAEAARQRLEADAALLLELQLDGYSGRRWNLFRDRLARYGCNVIRTWCLRGRIAAHCCRVGFGALATPPRPIDRDDATELAHETVARALHFFEHRVLRENRWEPRRGATLRTFFVGACIRAFTNEYNRWCNENRVLPSNKQRILHDVPMDQLPPEHRLDLESKFRNLPAQDRHLMTEYVRGATVAELAQIHGTTPKAIERRIQRIRGTP